MKNRTRELLLLAALVAAARPAAARDILGPPGTPIAAGGTTAITDFLAGAQLRAVITTHVVDIGGPAVQPPAVRTTNCTYGRVPCSVVDRIDLFVDGHAISVPRSVFADLADLNQGRFVLTPRNRLTLHFGGGDASEAYKLDIVFDRSRVLSRKRSVGEFPENFESTTYVEAPPNPNQ